MATRRNTIMAMKAVGAYGAGATTAGAIAEVVCGFFIGDVAGS